MVLERCIDYLSKVNKKGISTVISAILTHVVRIYMKYK